MGFPLPPGANARVIIVAGKRCRIERDDGTRLEAIARGKLFEDRNAALAVGDWVLAEAHHDRWMVEAVLPRANEYLREGLRSERQVLFVNVDRVLIVASLALPQTKAASVDRFLAAALKNGIPARIVLAKTDLDPGREREQELRALYSPFHLPIYPVSSLTGEGLDPLIAELATGVSALMGNSGVGKSSLLNRLIPGLDLRVREVSSWSGKGTHTTTAALLVNFAEQAALIDTPGMKSFVPYDVTPENLAELFPDIERLSAECYFSNCRHLSEPGCAVRSAIEDGDPAAALLRAYYRMRDGLSTTE
jgi:ribosome biogenesis GTPase / thiamine phosphate phosphatase